MTGIRLALLTIATMLLLAPSVPAQAVAFQPVVGVLPVGPTLSATPVVSADRRYVRLTLNPQFIDNAAFTTLSVPAAVGGGPGGPGALGRGGLGMGLGGGGGGQFLAGMNGVIDPTMMGYGFGGMPPGAGAGVGAGLDPNLALMGGGWGNAPPGWGAMPRAPQSSRAAAARSGAASRALKGGKKPQARAKPPATRTSGAGGTLH
jgi:hypothetical protein